MPSKSRTAARASIACAAAVLTACGAMPSQVAMPTINPDPALKEPRDRYKVGDKVLSDSTLEGVVPVERTYNRVKAQLEAHIVTWSQSSTQLAGDGDRLNNTSFTGAVVGAVGAIASKIDVTKAGTALAGGAGVWGDRYKFSVQEENYDLATDAMNCIYGQVTKLPQGFWSATFYNETDAAGHAGAEDVAVNAKKRVFQAESAVAAADAASGPTAAMQKTTAADEKAAAVSALEEAEATVAAKKPLGTIKVDIDDVRQPGQTDDEAVEAFHTIEDLFDTVHAALREVRKRLVRKQRVIDLAAPSATEIQNALQGTQEAADGADKGAARLKQRLVDAAKTDVRVPAVPTMADATRHVRAAALPPAGGASAVLLDMQAKYPARVAAHQRVYGDMTGAAARKKQKVLTAAAALPKAYFATALKMPTELTTCTKLIGG